MDERYLRRCPRNPVNNQPLRRRTENIMIAVPFVLCFSTFGIINLVGGTILTIMSCRPKASPKAMMILQKLAQDNNVKLESTIDPLQIVGIIILLTGSFLVIIGIVLGIIACRSVDEQRRKHDLRLSGQPMSSFGTRSRRTSSFCSTSFTSNRSRYNGKKALEKTVSPILELNGEDENMECDRLAVEVHQEGESNTYTKDMSTSVSLQTVQVSFDTNKELTSKDSKNTSSSAVAITIDSTMESAEMSSEINLLS
ncbi:uncharacterized protein TNIN_256941 [Trichonephila inaurata madagascariensis]|uniref:Uncharacterized protein n=1 Tax=Trichonephila inaurata madagascariensis TaxID=2747483 RepID=A0A8X6WN62_9ARAC|nr:uncharacterized protein TNIN_256941 [Trichonephila inaurata madagascariensis]